MLQLQLPIKIRQTFKNDGYVITDSNRTEHFFFPKGKKSEEMDYDGFCALAKKKSKKKIEYSTGQAIELVKQGFKVKNLNWMVKNNHYLKVIRTNEPDCNNQQFVALFFHNAGYMPRPYSFTDYDVFAGVWIIVD